jgi:hypothetical protein
MMRRQFNCGASPWDCCLIMLLFPVAFDKCLHFLAADVVAELLGWRLEKIRGWTNDGPAQFAVKRDLGAADGIDHHTRGVGAIPHFEFDLHVERNVAEGRAFHPEVCPLAISEPGHMVRRADVYVPRIKFIRDHTGDRRVVRGVFVELDSLYERGGTVAYADDGDTYFFCAMA